MKFEINYKRKLTLEDMDNLLVTALEGGIGYWATIDKNNVETPENFKRNKEIDYEFLDKVYQGSSLDVYDAENPDEKFGSLTLETIRKGISIIEKDHIEIVAGILQEEYDANEADIFFQCCILGEVTFG